MTKLIIALVAAVASGQECRLVPITPAQPELIVQEGETATQSRSFRNTAFGLSRDGVPHIFDRANRIRRVDPAGRMVTVAGDGTRAEVVTPGPALDAGLPTVGQILFSPDNTLHFTALGQVFRVMDGRIEPVAGSGRPGFNGETGAAAEVNLGTIVNAAFDFHGGLLLIDGFARVRRLDPDGTLRTLAGSARPSVAAGMVGDGGPATEAALSGPRQILPLPDGSFWIKDLSGRHIRLVTSDGTIDTVNRNFTATITLILLPDGQAAAAFANRVVRLRDDANLQTGALPFAPFTGTPLAAGVDGSLFFQGSSRPDQNLPLVQLKGRIQTVLAAAPADPVVDGQAAPFGIWNPHSGGLLYASSVDRKSGVVEARPGQTPRFVVGGGDDIGDADGKMATSLNIFGIVAFSLDGEGQIIVADVFRRRILVVARDGKTSVLKTQDGAEVVFAPTGILASLQRIAADAAGNIYWFSRGATVTGRPFEGEIAVWRKATRTRNTFTVTGLNAIARREDGSVMAIAGNGANFRTAYPISPEGQGAADPAFRLLPLQSITSFRGITHFIAASRLFRGAPGEIEMYDEPLISPGAAFPADFVTAAPDLLIIHRTNGGFFLVDNAGACATQPQPVIEQDGLVNAASFEFPFQVAPLQLATVRARGFGPAQGQGTILNGLRRAAGQPAPYPALVMGNFSGVIPMATLTGTALPVIHSNDRQVTVQAPPTAPASGEYLLYFSWQGLQLIQTTPVRVRAAVAALFTSDGSGEGPAAALNEDGSRHGESQPARAGSLIHLFGTGFGVLDRGFGLGEFFGGAEATTALAVDVTMGGQAAAVEFAGGAEGLVGVYRITVRVPPALASGEHPVAVSVPGQPRSERRVTIRVAN